MTAVDPQLEALRAQVVAAASALADHHFVWMTNALRTHFEAVVERNELAFARHMACHDVPLVPRLRAEGRDDASTRAMLVAEAHHAILTNNAILLFVEALHALVSRGSALRFADAFARTRGQHP